jgi:hypothetical protein
VVSCFAFSSFLGSSSLLSSLFSIFSSSNSLQSPGFVLCCSTVVFVAVVTAVGAAAAMVGVEAGAGVGAEIAAGVGIGAVVPVTLVQASAGRAKCT